MEIFLTGLVVLCGAGILHTYLIYPTWTIRWADRIAPEKCYYAEEVTRSDILTDEVANSSVRSRYFASRTAMNPREWPRVTVLMAVHNEEKVLAKKLDGLLLQDYPGTLQILVGSDNSTDGTNAILNDYATRDDRLKAVLFTSRRGKPGIVNALSSHAAPAAPDHFYLLTDASVMLEPNVTRRLIEPALNRPDLALIDARMIHVGIRATGIGRAEGEYISHEVKLKQAEGRLWGYTIGPFGGCYTLRSDYFDPVPDNFLVDDFYLCMRAYEKGGRGISVAAARCYEGVGQRITEEFRRKVRISAGNWQNALRFSRLWRIPTNRLGFAFFSHKILRWLTPFLLLGLLVGLALLALNYGNYWAGTALIMVGAVMILPPILDYTLTHWLGLNYYTLRAPSYFSAMNLALLVGFFRFLKGIRSNVWQPSNRH